MEALLSQTVPAVGEQRLHALRCENNRAGGLELRRAILSPRMAMQPTQSLQQYVRGTNVGDEEIGIDVEALFERLRADDDEAAGTSRTSHLRRDLCIEKH